jgi:hypothetical protein
MSTPKKAKKIEHFHDLPLPTNDWPIAGNAGTVPVEQETSTIQAFGISSNGRRIVGTHFNLDRNESHVITFSHILGTIVPGGSGSASWVADPISQDSQVSGRGINNEGDVVGFMLTAALDPDQTVPYFRPGDVPINLEPGIFATQPTTLTGAEIILPDDRTASSAASGINKHRIVVGNYVDLSSENSVGFSLDLRLQTPGVGLVNVASKFPARTATIKACRS